MYFVTDWNSAISKFAWQALFSSRNMAAPYVKPTWQHNAVARLMRRTHVFIISLILLWKISQTYFTLHVNLICLIDCLRILPDSENLKEYLYGPLTHVQARYIVISYRIDDVDI